MRQNIPTEETGLLSNVLIDFRMNIAYCALWSGLN
jgi:hypothetical protein